MVKTFVLLIVLCAGMLSGQEPMGPCQDDRIGLPETATGRDSTGRWRETYFCDKGFWVADRSTVHQRRITVLEKRVVELVLRVEFLECMQKMIRAHTNMAMSPEDTPKHCGQCKKEGEVIPCETR